MMYAIIGAGTGLSVYLSIIIARDHAPLLAGLGIVTYVLGLRHGVDADHIVAIDNTIRKLLQDDQKPFSVGLWFSLGLSTVVMGLIVALVFATQSVVGVLLVLRCGGAVLGSIVLGAFLWLLVIV